jgi:hypothetical protein
LLWIFELVSERVFGGCMHVLSRIMSHLKGLRPERAESSDAAEPALGGQVFSPEILLRAPAVEAPQSLRRGAMLGEAEARSIYEQWKALGGYAVSDSGRSRMTSGYQSWKQRVELFLSRPPQDMRDRVEGWRRWLAEYETYARWMLTQKNTAPRVPGPAPFELALQVLDGEPLGQPPSISFRQIRIYNVKLPDGARYSFHDDPVQLGDKNPAYEAGVARIGVKLHKRPDIDALLTDAGIADPTERKVMKKIAEVESGFEAINTCDAGEVSVGFVPFTSDETGEGPLNWLLRNMKSAAPEEFDGYFRTMGIDVGDRGLTVVHLEHGRLLHGREAVHAIRDDKRLTAVFQNAGEKSRAYQVAQLRLAQQLYYLASQDFTLKCLVKSGEKAFVLTLSGRYGDVLRSEAGKVALMDRAVYRGLGNARQTFKEACTAILHEKGLSTLRALAEYEAFITPLVQPPGRIRVMEDKELSKPMAAPVL